MKNQILYLLIILFLIFSSCQKAKNLDEQSGSEYSKKVQEIIERKNSEIEAGYLAGLIDSVAPHFAEQSIQLPPNQPPLIGIENFKDAWIQNFQIGEWKFDLNTQQVKANGNLATEFGTYTVSFSPNENSPIPAIKDKGSYVVLWEKINNEWKIVWDAPVSEIPMPNMMTDSILEK